MNVSYVKIQDWICYVQVILTNFIAQIDVQFIKENISVLSGFSEEHILAVHIELNY